MTEQFPRLSEESGPVSESAKQYFTTLANFYRRKEADEEPSITSLDNSSKESTQVTELIDKFMTAYFGKDYHMPTSDTKVGTYEVDDDSQHKTYIGRLLEADKLFMNGSIPYHRALNEHGMYFIYTINPESEIINMTIAYNDGLGAIAGKSHVAYEFNRHTSKFEKLDR